MAFEPIGGYPPVRPKVPGQTDSKNLESRGFQRNPVSVGAIINAKKKRDFLTAFGTDEDLDIDMSRVLPESPPHEYDTIDYVEPKQTSKNARSSKGTGKTSKTVSRSKKNK